MEGGRRLEDGGELPLYWPPLIDIFQSFFYAQLDLIDPLFLQIKSVCLYLIQLQR